ncbi:GNAT family N-acetyltransferase [Chitinophaga solisilvae]|uniref:GNAT family N-acetyltransferase n=1 Tax=Chitinophaga solisilvae TaxID=1233460 RepID=UPI001370478A|nr:GNAT family N-acetyltransferase [Chitinophaga solisilvae]
MELQFTPFPELTTGRLLLRQPESHDDIALLRIRSDDEVRRYIQRPKNSLEDVQQFIQKVRQGIAANENLYWVIIHRETQELMGTFCLWNLSAANNSAEIGYELHPDYQHQGYMQEAITAVIDYAFHTMKAGMITAFTVEENQASIRVLERNHFLKAPPEMQEEAEDDGIIYILNR